MTNHSCPFRKPVARFFGVRRFSGAATFDVQPRGDFSNVLERMPLAAAGDGPHSFKRTSLKFAPIIKNPS